jgi:hypothetical protein
MTCRLLFAILLLCLPWIGELEDDLPSIGLSLVPLPGLIPPSPFQSPRLVAVELPPVDILLLLQRQNE